MGSFGLGEELCQFRSEKVPVVYRLHERPELDDRSSGTLRAVLARGLHEVTRGLGVDAWSNHELGEAVDLRRGQAERCEYKPLPVGQLDNEHVAMNVMVDGPSVGQPDSGMADGVMALDCANLVTSCLEVIRWCGHWWVLRVVVWVG